MSASKRRTVAPTSPRAAKRADEPVVSTPIAKSTPPRKIRDPEFAKRLAAACDQNPHCPPMHRGRQVWLIQELKRRYDITVSPETARKWYSGEAKPRPDKTAKLAEILAVDGVWLEMGVTPDLAPRDRKVRNAMADGAVNLVAGLIQMDGGHPAFPDDAGVVDLHAIIRGGKYDLHIAMADDSGKFVIPAGYEQTIVLGLMRDGFNFQVYEISEDVIQAHGEIRGGSIELDVSKDALKRVESFATRL